jgi:ribonuclease VapC
VIAVDASAVLAILLEEDDAAMFVDALASADLGVISAVNYWEVLVGAARVFGPASEKVVAGLLDDSGLSIASVDAEMARAAVAAFARFRGRSGGRLNLGDSFAYALAQREGDGLLYKGNDFPKTDVKSVLDR